MEEEFLTHEHARAFDRSHRHALTQKVHIVSITSGSSIVVAGLLTANPVMVIAGITAGILPAWLSSIALEQEAPRVPTWHQFSTSARQALSMVKFWATSAAAENTEHRQQITLLNSFLVDEPEECSERACVVCLSHRRTSACVPCGHKVLCGTCAQAVLDMAASLSDQQARCPVCRQSVTGILGVYE